MNRLRFYFKTSICLIVFIFLIAANRANFNKKEQSKKKNVLVIQSYHNGFSWTDSIMLGIRSVFNKSKHSRNIFVEYLDTKRYYSDDFKTNLYNLFKYKYQNYRTDRTPDVLITADDNAFNFIKHYHDSLFSKTPLVFCGINYFSNDSLQKLKNITGIVERTNFVKNLELIKKIHPDLENLAIVFEASTTGKQFKKAFLEDVAKFDLAGTKLHYYDNLDLFSLIENLKNLPENSAVLLTPFMRDAYKNFYEAKESASYITKQINVPVYTTHKHVMESGVVGGYLNSGFIQGKYAALFAEEIINNPGKELPKIHFEGTESYYFDQQALDRFNINRKLLPVNSKIINIKKHSFLFSVHATITFILTILFLSMIIVILYLNIQKRKKAEASLKELQEDLAETIKKRTKNLHETNVKLLEQIQEKQKAESKLLNNIDYTRTILNNLPDIVFIISNDCVYLDIITSNKNLLYKERKELIGRTLDEALPPYVAEKLRKAVVKSIKKSKPITIDYPLDLGKKYWFEARIVPVNNYRNNMKVVIALVLDVTERKMMELSLVKIRKALNSSGDGVIVFERNGRVSFANPAMKTMLGYKGSDFRTVSDIAEAFSEREKAAEVFEKVRSGSFWSGEVQLKKNDGSLAEVLFRTDAIIDEDNDLLGYIATLSDLTRQKNQERMITAQLSYIENLIETIPLPIFIKDHQGIIKRVNQEFCNFVGKLKPQIIGKSLLDIFHEDSALIYLSSDQKLRHTKRNQIIETNTFDGLGRKRNVIVHVSLLKNEEAGEEDTITAFTDVTNLKDIEFELQKGRKELVDANYKLKQSVAIQKSLIESPHNINIYALDRNFNYISFNENHKKWMKKVYKVELSEGLNFFDIIRNEIKEEARENYNLVLNGQVITRKDSYPNENQARHIERLYSPIYSEEGNIEGLTVFITDITKQKEAEAELKKAIFEAKTANEEKSRFLANMSHEIRTPMNGVIGLANLLGDLQLTKEQKEYVNLIRSSAASLLEIINDILDLSKIESGKMELDHSVFNLQNLLKSIISLMEVNAKNKGINLICNYRTRVPKYLIGDSIRIRQIIINVLNNAIKFTSKGYVEINITSKDLGADMVKMEFEINDTGIGIPEEKLSQIFESFSQADSSTTRKFGGTGLGLSISKMLLELMDGSVKASRRETGGSTFFITIPLYLAKKDEIEIKNDTETDKVDINLPKMKALVVEDNYINRRLIDAVLKKYNQETSTAENGIEALYLFNKDTYDYIVMDGQMPEMDGFEATMKIREKEKTSNDHIPIVALTASAIQGEAEKFYEAGMDYYLTKPLDEKKLVKILVKIAKLKKTGLTTIRAKSLINSPESNFESKSYHYLDYESFRKNYHFLDDSDVVELLESFIKSFKDALVELEESCQKTALGKIDNISHPLKGSSGSLFMPDVADLFTKLNIASRKGDITECINIFENLKSIQNDVISELSDIIASFRG